MAEPAYDRIGIGYAGSRRADPRIAARIEAALGDAASVVNVGAGAGSYEPADREVVAVEPSREMLAQRPASAAPALQAAAELLPLANDAVDAAMTVFSVHHWDDWRRGVAEMRRVARRRVVVLTFDPEYLLRGWLGEYVPEIAADDRGRFPPVAELRAALGDAGVETVPVPADCRDLFLGALWARPELVLDDGVRASTSGFARLDPEVELRAVARLRADLESGRWDERHGHLRRAAELDVGVRLLSGS
jgi:SAM-dependent methyltransferase